MAAEAVLFALTAWLLVQWPLGVLIGRAIRQGAVVQRSTTSEPAAPPGTPGTAPPSRPTGSRASLRPSRSSGQRVSH